NISHLLSISCTGIMQSRRIFARNLAHYPKLPPGEFPGDIDLKSLLNLPKSYLEAWPLTPRRMRSALEQKNIMPLRIVQHSPSGCRLDDAVGSYSGDRRAQVGHLKEQHSLILRRIWLHALLFKTDESDATLKLCMVSRFFIR